MAMGVGARALLYCTCWAAAASANTSGALVSSIGEQQQQQRRQQHQEALRVVEKSRRGDTRLRGGASSRTMIDISYPQDQAQAAAAAAASRGGGGGRIVDEGETASLRHARERVATVMSVAREDEPKGNRAATGLPDTIKQGVRSDDRNRSTTQDSEHGETAERVAVVALCIGGAIVVILGWCWLSSLVVCVSWCVCKCAQPRSRERSSSGDNTLKHADSYANAVRATFCGNLASVVCAPDEEAATSQPCTPQPGSDGIVVEGSTFISSNNTYPNNAASSSSDRATAPTAVSDAAQGAGSNQSTFSATFRRYLTATAITPATPASTAAAQNISPEFCSQYPQQQPGSGGDNISEISTAFCSTATDGREIGGGAESLFWDEEEKRSDNVTVVAPPHRTRRPGVLRLFRYGSDNRNGRGNTDGDLQGGESTGAALPALTTSWRARVWARMRSTGGSAGESTPVGSVQDAAAGVPSDTNYLERSSEGRLQNDTDRRPGAPMASVAESPQDQREVRAMVETVSHRRRTARRLAESRGRGGDGEFRASGPAVRDDGRNNDVGVAAGSGCDGGGAGVSSGISWSDSRDSGRAATGHLRLPEVVAAGAAVGAVTDGNSPSGRSCGGGGGEAGGARREAEATVVRGTAGHSLAGWGGITESPTPCTDCSTGSNVVAAAGARTKPDMPSAGQHYPEGESSADTGKDRGGKGGGEVGRGGDGEETEPKSPALPRARVLWRAFSEVDHDTITENHRLAGLRHLARFAPPPGIENPLMCYVPL